MKLFRQTIIYGVATVFPRIISVVLVRIHTDKSVISEVSEFGTLSLIFSYIILFNVILSYGLETSFFRFYNKEENKKDVLNTAAISIIITGVLIYLLVIKHAYISASVAFTLLVLLTFGVFSVAIWGIGTSLRPK